MQHFYVSQESPGVVITRTGVDSAESQFQLFKKGVKATSFSDDDLPLIVRPEGVSQDRFQYFLKEVQPFV